MFINIGHFAANGFQNFLRPLIRTFGYSDTISLVHATPPHLLGTIISNLQSYTSGRYREKTWHITVSKIIVASGFVICLSTLNVAARFFAIFLFAGFSYGVNNINISWAAATIGQTDEKKSVGIAIVNTVGNCASILSPYLWPDSDSPRFVTAQSASLAFCGLAITPTWVMRFILMRENERI